MTTAVGSFSADERRRLLDVASAAVRHGLRHGVTAALRLEDLPPALQAPRASFVTLKLAAGLRGCIGTLKPIRPLAADVNENAFAAAFRDPRFPPLAPHELAALRISISVLSAPEAMTFTSEADLIAQLRPGSDGLIIEEGQRRGTFLPAVWESLPEPRTFLRHLKLKAGLHPEHWPRGLRVYRYHAEVIGGE